MGGWSCTKKEKTLGECVGWILFFNSIIKYEVLIEF